MSINKKRQAGSERGVALFMVMSALGLLSVLVAELTYTTQMNSRLAYNYVDGLKAYYLAKAGFKLSMIRLKAYAQISNFTGDASNKQIKDSLPAGIIDKIWSFPFIYPMPIPKEASMSESDAIKDFMKESKLSGSYTAAITSESAKLNLNNLFITEAIPETTTGPATSPTTPTTPNPTPTPSPTPTPVDFRKEVLEPAISTLIEQKKTAERDFADVYRNVNGKDIVDAIVAYLKPDAPPSNLPGFRPMKAKGAPLYSLTELHFIPGLDDELYRMLEGILTVYTTPGVNVNSANRRTFQSFFHELTEPEIDNLIAKRDDPDQGKPWSAPEDFWKSLGEVMGGKSSDPIKERFQKAGIKIVTEEKSFKIAVQATVGLATRRIEAQVLLDPKAAAAKKDQPIPGVTGSPPGVNVAGQPPGNAVGPQDGASSKKPSGLKLVYWRMY